MTPDTLRTVAQLQAVLDMAYRSGYADATVTLQARADSLQHLLDATISTTWADVAVGATTGLILGLILLTFAIYMDRR